MKETPFRKRAMKQLKALPNTKWTRIEQQSIRGTPDTMGCLFGHLILIEFKASGKEATKQQSYELGKWEEVGAVVFEATPENWDEVYGAIERLAKNGIY